MGESGLELGAGRMQTVVPPAERQRRQKGRDDEDGHDIGKGEGRKKGAREVAALAG